MRTGLKVRPSDLSPASGICARTACSAWEIRMGPVNSRSIQEGGAAISSVPNERNPSKGDTSKIEAEQMGTGQRRAGWGAQPSDLSQRAAANRRSRM